MAKVTPSSLQFPKIYRFITEKVKSTEGDLKMMVLGIVFGVMIALIFTCSFYLAVSLKEKDKIDQQRKTILAQVVYWERVVEKQRDYRDGYFMLAVLQYQLKDFNKSEEYLGKALEIDPNFSPAQDLQKLLNREEE